MILKQLRFYFVFLLLVGVLGITGCGYDPIKYGQQINKAMNYEKENKIRLFVQYPDQNKRQIPSYIEVKYIDQEKIKTYVYDQLVSDSIKWLERIKGSEQIRQELSKERLTGEEVVKKVSAWIETTIKENKEREVIKAEYKETVSEYYHLDKIESMPIQNDLVFWVTHYGTNFAKYSRIRFEILNKKYSDQLFCDVIFPSSLRGDQYPLGMFELSNMAYRRESLVVIKNEKNHPQKKYTLDISGEYIVKASYAPYETGDKRYSKDYLAFMKKEIWWKIHRQVDFYFDEKGVCHFESERQIYDESQNPSTDYTGEVFDKNYKPKSLKEIEDEKIKADAIKNAEEVMKKIR